MFTILSLLLLIIVTRCYCVCPGLKPNLNVLVRCSDLSKRQLNCTSKYNNTETGIPAGTIAVFKCAKHFKSLGRISEGGKMNCTGDGTWTNQKAFQNFYCEFDCGRQPSLQNELISQGNSTKSRNWPWVAAIFRQTKDGQFKYSCGGTLIGQMTILTAAHCVTDVRTNKLSYSIVRVSLAAVSSNFEQNVIYGAQILAIREIYVHPDYNAASLVADVAIIVLSVAARFSYSVLPICLPKSYEYDSIIVGSGNMGEASSFGIDSSGRTSQVLQHAHIPVVPNARCHDLIEVVPNGDQFCGGNPAGPKICRGDSGSGLVFNSVDWNEGRYSVHGIVSNTGELEQSCASMVVFTKVISYISWIQEKILAIENLGPRNINPAKLPRAKGDVTRLSRLYTSAEIKALSKLRPLVKNILLEDYMHRDEYLIRFLRAKLLNIQEATEMLQSTMEWRKANRMNEILNEDFTNYRKAYPIFFQGYDKDGRPVFVYPFGHYGSKLEEIDSLRDFEKFSRYNLRNFEKKEAQIRATGAGNITQAVIIFDFHGPNFKRHLCLKCLQIWTTSSQQMHSYFPQQTYSAYYINTPASADRIIDAFIPTIPEYRGNYFLYLEKTKQNGAKHY